MRIVLVRHAETQWNIEGRYQGQGFDVPLAATGIAQAEALAKRFVGMPFQRVAASPLLRARQTAEHILTCAQGTLYLEAALREIHHGAWEGRLAQELAKEDPQLVRAWRETPHEVTLPGGESLEDVQTRAWQALSRLTEGLLEQDTLLMVGHDGVNRVILCKVMGLPLSQVWRFRQAPTCVNLLEGPSLHHLSLVRLNDATHLFPLFGEMVHRRL